MKKNILILVLSSWSLVLSAQVLFEEITVEAGVANPNNKNHGIAFGDFDNDGDEDIYAFTRLGENRLYENLGNGTFNNIASVAGVDHDGSTRAAVWGDINNDGYLDLYIGSYQEADRLYLNNGPVNNGNFSFTDITFNAGIINEEETISVHMADVDQDGLLDIYVANYLAENRLYKNNGNLTFSDFTNIAGVNDDSFSMGCVFFDYDRDGDLDLYLAHDFEVPNILYQNDGTGKFTNVAETAGVDIAKHGMGVDVADINHDGWLDFYITDLDENVLFLNNGDGTFSDISAQAGIEDTGMGWSTMFLDVDNDTWPDLYVVNDSKFSPEPNVLYHNNGDNTFTAVELDGAIASAEGSVGGACADINNDGFIDLAIANAYGNEGNQLFQNMGNENHWIAFKLEGARSNRSAVGAEVTIEYGNGEQQTDIIAAGTGFAGSNSLNLHFGLAEYETVAKAIIRWPSGLVETMENLTADQVHEFRETKDPIILNNTMRDTIVEQYGKFECTVDVDATYDNPYDYDEVRVSAVMIAPGGSTRRIDGFFMQEYDLNTVNGSLVPVGDGVFKVRFAPDEIGTWRFQVSVQDSEGTTMFEEQTFDCVAITSEYNKGFVRVGRTNYLEFDTEEQYILIGENMAWQNSNAYTNYRSWLNQLHENGGNFIRLWHAHWGLGIEWKNGWQGFDGLMKYKQSNCFYQDWLYDYCAEKGIYVMLALQHHGPVSTNVNPNWNDSPYNASNGGPCQNTWGFFTDTEAKKMTKNRYRYIVARWGYARSIQSWELFNEVNWTDNFNQHLTKVQDWHAEMASYLKAIDPYNHIVTTSFADAEQDPVTWMDPNMDMTQTHYYINTANIERALVNGVRTYLEEFEKPTLTGEFGLGGNPNLANADPDGIHFHNGMWGPLFGGGMGVGMTWWWDVYINPRDLYYHFAPISIVTNEIPFRDKNMHPGQSYALGAPGDFIVTPTAGWGIVGDESVTVTENGTTIPSSPRLGQYLYGSSWNTQYRSPPTFEVTFPEAGELTVRTSSESGTDPKISIYLDGELVLNEDAGTNETFTIQIPAGQHSVKVDNLGTDWITVSSYTFTGIGTKVDTYTVIGEDKDAAAGWILNQEYNHINVLANGQPSSIVGSEVVIEDFAEGEYFVKWYDCLTGALVASEPVTTENGELKMPVPEFIWDLSFRVDNEAVVINTDDVAQNVNFKVYPNPVQSGAPIQLDLGEEQVDKMQLALLDASGKLVASMNQPSSASPVQIPNNLASGLYWVLLKGEGKIGTKAIYVD